MGKLRKCYNIEVWHYNRLRHIWLYRPLTQEFATSKAEAIAKAKEQELEFEADDKPERLRAWVRAYIK